MGRERKHAKSGGDIRKISRRRPLITSTVRGPKGESGR